MKSFSEFLIEKFTNLLPHHEEEKQQHAHHIFKMVNDAYSHIGGIHGSGFESPESMVKNIPMWKIHKNSEGKPNAVALYKDKEGRKRVAIASDGTHDGKSGLSKIIKDDVLRGRSYAEISGPSLSFHKKIIPDLKNHTFKRSEVKKFSNEEIRVPKPHDPELVKHPELKDHLYQRKIGNEWHTKIMVGKRENPIK